MPRNAKSAAQTRRPRPRDDGTPVTVGGGGRDRGRPIKIEFEISEWDTSQAATDGFITLRNDKRGVKKLKLGTADDSVSITVPLKGGVTIELLCKE